MAGRTFPVRFLRATFAAAERRGVRLDEWMGHLDINPALLSDERSRITVHQASQLIRDLWRAGDDELLGLGPEPAPLGTFALLAQTVIGAPDLKVVLDRMSQFCRVIPAFPGLTVTTGPDTTRVVLELDSIDDPEHVIADIVMATGLRFFAWLGGTRLPLESVELPYEMPEHPDDYQLAFGAHVRFGCPEPAMVLRNEVLTMPVVRSQADLDAWLKRSPYDILSQRDYSTRVPDQVRRILERGLLGDWPSAESVADQLSMSVQNLRRLLRDHGTSMSAIRDEVMRDEAITSLVRGEESAAALSARLGFSEPSAFHRAFRRWTGTTPGAYRPHSRAENRSTR